MLHRHAGFTLFEVMVAIAILGMVVGLIYGSFATTARSKEEIEIGNDIYHEARWALDKLEPDLASAYGTSNPNSQAVFLSLNHTGASGAPQDYLHFSTFSHVKFNPLSRESDQANIKYFVMTNPETGVPTLYRWEDASMTPQDDISGTDPSSWNGEGQVFELAEGVLAFDLRFWDGYDWTEEWDSRELTAEDEVSETIESYDEEMTNTLPMAVDVALVMAGPDGEELLFHTKMRLLLSTIDMNAMDEEDESGEEDGEDNASDGSSEGGVAKGSDS